MSLRHLKKVFNGDGANQLPALDLSDEDPEVYEAQPAQKQSKGKKKQMVRNKFELLAAATSAADEDEENEDDIGENGREGDGSDQEDEAIKKTSKKRRKKKKKVQKAELAPNDDVTPKPKNAGESADEFQDFCAPEMDERALKEMARRRGMEELFEIDPKTLNPELELKRIFGSRVVNHEKSGPRYHNSSNQQRRKLMGRRGRLVYPKERRTFNGPTGITLELLSTDEKTGFKIFKFNHSQSYREVQKQFLAAVNTLNPDTIVALMRSHPYHIDAHIQLSDMAKHSEDMQIASELVEDGINYLQNVFDHQFDICSPTCQLPYKYQENRSLHVLLFKYLIFLGQRGCPCTALQLCKKLITLDLNDPLGVTLMIDFYALKGQEFAWLCNLYEYWNTERNLNQLPNWAYSVALAHFLKQNETNTSDMKKNKSHSSKEATSDPEMDAKSNELLQYALLMFPSVLIPLLEKCGIQSDSKVINHWYFNSSVPKKQTKSLNLLCDLYVWRTHHLWRDASILRWLEFNTQAVISQIDKDSKVTNDFALKRQRRYAGSPYSILRHVILIDSKDITIPLPTELSKKPILSFDPITPEDAIDIYNYRGQELSRPSAAAAGNNGGLLSMLFRSLVFDLNAFQAIPPLAGGGGNVELRQAAARAAAAENHVQEHQEAVGAAAAANPALAGIHESVNTLLGAMRDLLQVVTPAGPRAADGADGGNADAEGDSSDSDDDE